MKAAKSVGAYLGGYLGRRRHQSTEEVFSVVTQYVSELEKQAEKPLREAYEIIYALSDDQQCRLDHHGYCQEHSRFDVPCPNKLALEWLERNKKYDSNLDSNRSSEC